MAVKLDQDNIHPGDRFFQTPLTVRATREGSFLNHEGVNIPVEIKKSTGFWDWLSSVFGCAKWATVLVEIHDESNPHQTRLEIVQINLKTIEDFQNGILSTAKKAELQYDKLFTNSRKIFSSLVQTNDNATVKSNSQKLANCIFHAVDHHRIANKALKNISFAFFARAENNLRHQFLALLGECQKQTVSEGAKLENIPLEDLLQLAQRLGLTLNFKELLLEGFENYPKYSQTVLDCARALNLLTKLDTDCLTQEETGFLEELLGNIPQFSSNPNADAIVTRFILALRGTGLVNISEVQELLNSVINQLNKEKHSTLNRVHSTLANLREQVDKKGWKKMGTVPNPPVNARLQETYKAILSEPLPPALKKARQFRIANKRAVQQQVAIREKAAQRLRDIEADKPPSYADLQKLQQEAEALKATAL